MKIAVSGKGGVGKTLLASRLARAFADAGYSVIAIDADPDANLAATLGFPHPDSIIPISEMSDLIEERTGARPGTVAPLYRLNPKVDDLPQRLSVEHEGIRLMVMGRIKRGGTGCYCPEGTLLQALLSHLLLEGDEVVILDMEAGIEHLARGTARVVDRLIIVVEPGRRSIETATRIDGLARDLGVRNINVVGNKIRGEFDRNFIISSLPGFEFLGFIPFDEALVDADIGNRSLLDSSNKIAEEVRKIYSALISGMTGSDNGSNTSTKARAAGQN